MQVLQGATEDTWSVPYYAMYDRWEYVSDWVLLVMAPVENVDPAISVEFSTDRVELDTSHGERVHSSVALYNAGTLDVRVAPSAWPRWLVFEVGAAALVGYPVTLGRGDSIKIEFHLDSTNLEAGTSSGNSDDHSSWLHCLDALLLGSTDCQTQPFAIFGNVVLGDNNHEFCYCYNRY